jgi:peptide/nickel transport system ATP-binding protein/oligopeptide transport system ATP-binding protein
MDAAQMTREPLLALRGLSVSFATPSGRAKAVDAIDLDVGVGEVVGLVGESGSGKSVTLRAILRLLGPPAEIGGSVAWRGTDLARMNETELRRVRGREIAMIFQEPMAALNPVLTIGLQIEESLATHLSLGGRAARNRAAELLAMVGIADARRRLNSYPHEFSGGMRQRVMIAIALAAGPKLLLADEPTTALDVTIQDQILKLMLRLRRELEMSIVLVTHDLSVVAQSCDRVAVIYGGRIMELGPVAEVFRRPAHAYTLGLIGAVPSTHKLREPLANIPGAPPSFTAMPEGCRFAPRCSLVEPRCREDRLDPVAVAPDHISSCIRHSVVLNSSLAAQ